MRVIDSIAELRRARASLLGHVGAVYTMGALHAGHVNLLEQAREENDAVIGTVFVNPAQFSIGEDFAAYPRAFERDLALMEAVGVDVVFSPPATEMYPSGFQTTVSVDEASQGLEGAQRPGHFRGVATVVAKLFNLTLPTTAYFGQKDAQQVVVLRRMVADLNFPLAIAVCPTVREADGLAMSSRNAYLRAPEEREAAAVVYRALQAAAAVYESGEREPAALRDAARTVLETEPLAQADYVAVNYPDTMRGVLLPTDSPVLLSVAVQVGKPRLLDNLLLPASLNTRAGLTATLGQLVE
ncbi:MAG TPA: pantoate--beta-alanine ligase [Candidatus Limnocylindrales bacterium]|nr:pantoate--beta-alanine ligase [Candidatus Limnocylindrales bacterium]